MLLHLHITLIGRVFRRGGTDAQTSLLAAEKQDDRVEALNKMEIEADDNDQYISYDNKVSTSLDIV